MAVAVLRYWNNAATGKHGRHILVWCPGCNDLHGIEVDPVNEPHWGWTGDLASLTVRPSLKVEGVQWAPKQHFYKPTHYVQPGEATCCHSYIHNGNWEYLGDCTHALRDSVVPLPPLPEGLFEVL